MIDEAFERLRASNPVPVVPPAPPIERVLERTGRAATKPPRRRRGGLLPAVSIAAAIAVAVVAIIVVGHHRDRSATGGEPSVPNRPLLLTPRSAMPGVVQLDGAAFPSQTTGVISIEQCYPCGGPNGRTQVRRTWTVTTADGGRTWLQGRGPALMSVAFSGHEDGWAVDGNPAGGARLAHAYVSHDGGRTWTAAATPPGWSIGSVSVAGGTVWATAVDTHSCTLQGQCSTIVLRGGAAGSSLSQAPGQPITDRATARIVAAGPRTAYIDAAVSSTTVVSFATRDGGRTWQPVPNVCEAAGLDGILTAGGASSVWRACWIGAPTTLIGRSGDGGDHWRTFRVPAPSRGDAPYRVQAVSPRVAWELTDHSDVIRITDGGARCSRVWSRSRSQYTLVPGIPRALTAVDERTAYLTVMIPPVKDGITHGTYIVVYETHDGGTTWRPSIVPLTAG